MNSNNNINNDVLAARRQALKDALHSGDPVVVSPSGEVQIKEEADEKGISGIQVPDGKLAMED